LLPPCELEDVVLGHILLLPAQVSHFACAAAAAPAAPAAAAALQVFAKFDTSEEKLEPLSAELQVKALPVFKFYKVRPCLPVTAHLPPTELQQLADLVPVGCLLSAHWSRKDACRPAGCRDTVQSNGRRHNGGGAVCKAAAGLSHISDAFRLCRCLQILRSVISELHNFKLACMQQLLQQLWSRLATFAAAAVLVCMQDGREVVQQVVGYKKKPLEAAVEQLAATK
jgi:hypothetical protein